MPRNKIGGNKHKKAKNNVSNTNIRLKEDNQEYAKVISILGNCRFNIQCSDGVERLGILRGNMRKKKFVNKDDIILIEKWDDLQTGKSSIIDVYKEEHVKKLKKMKEIPSLFFSEESSLDNLNPFDDVFTNSTDYFGLSDENSDEELHEEIDKHKNTESDEEIDLDEI
mgnify:CR=1 FL=1|tara:strand:- start:1681 stop:2184 length:504 start_codon:yes stop_codon:yes gene_type:complete